MKSFNMCRRSRMFHLCLQKDFKEMRHGGLLTILEFLTPVVLAVILCTTIPMTVTYMEGNNYTDFCPAVQEGNVTTNETGLLARCPVYAFRNTSQKIYNLVYSPNSSKCIRGAMNKFHMICFKVIGFENSKELNKFISDPNRKQFKDLHDPNFEKRELDNMTNKMFALEFPDDLKSVNECFTLCSTDIRIRFPGDWQTDVVFPTKKVPGPREPDSNTGKEPDYGAAGFLQAMQLVVSFLIVSAAGAPFNETDCCIKYGWTYWITYWNHWWFHVHPPYPVFFLKRFPNGRWTKRKFITDLPFICGLFVNFAFFFTFLQIVRAVAHKKEKHLWVSMTNMGIPEIAIWLALFLRGFLVLFFGCLVFSIFFKIKFGVYAVFLYTDFTVLLLLLTLYACATIALAFLLGALFTSVRAATRISACIWFVLTVVGTFQHWFSLESAESVMGSSLISNSAIFHGFHSIEDFEEAHEGSHWYNLCGNPDPDVSVGLCKIYLLLIIDTLIYMLIAYYIISIYPGEGDLGKPWNFLCSVRYWFNVQEKESGNEGRKGENQREKAFDDPDLFKPDENGEKPEIVINKLVKVYGKHVVLKRMSMNAYKGHITVLMGPSGSGKTTVISILAGFQKPTRGTAIIGGYDIRKDMKKIKKIEGTSTQHSILFEKFTVQDHLSFVCRVKGFEGRKMKSEVLKYLNLFDLENMKNTKIMKLSEVDKKKLCIAMALIGDSRIVLLDDPIAGLQESDQIVIRDILVQQKAGRTIFLTVETIEEAELFGGKVVSIIDGVVQFSKSIAVSDRQLRSRFEDDSTPEVAMEMEPEMETKVETENKGFKEKTKIKEYKDGGEIKEHMKGYVLKVEMTPTGIPQDVTGLLKSHLPNIKAYQNADPSVIYVLPSHWIYFFERTFVDLELKSFKLGVSDYSLKYSNLDDLYEKIQQQQLHEMGDGRKSRKARKEAKSNIKGLNKDLNKGLDKGFNTGFDKVLDSSLNKGLDKDLDQNKKKGEVNLNTGNINKENIDKGNLRKGNVSKENLDEGNVDKGNKDEESEKTGWSLLLSQGVAMAMKMFFYLLLTWKTLLIQILIALLLPLMLMLAADPDVWLPEGVPMRLDMSKFKKSITFIEADPAMWYNTTNWEYFYKKHLKEKNNEYVVKPYGTLEQEIMKIGERRPQSYGRRYVIGASFTQTGENPVITVWFHGDPGHAIAINLAIVLDSFFYNIKGFDCKLNLINHPLPRLKGEVEQGSASDYRKNRPNRFSATRTITFIAILTLACLLPFFILSCLTENISGLMHLHFISGQNVFIYWLSFLFYDLLLYMVEILIIVLVVACFFLDGFYTPDELAIVYLLLLCYGLCMLPLMYLFGRKIFKTAHNAYCVTLLFLFFGGIFGAFFNLMVLGNQQQLIRYRQVHIEKNMKFSYFCPFINLADGFENMQYYRDYTKMCYFTSTEDCSEFKETGRLSVYFPGVGQNCLIFLLMGLIFFLILIRTGSGASDSKTKSDHKEQNPPDMDEDGVTSTMDKNKLLSPTLQRIRAEREIIENTPFDDLIAKYGVVMVNLTKRFGKKTVVDGLYLTVQIGECFVLLGPNGSGKTTIFQMLTGSVSITEGDAYVLGNSVKKKPKDVHGLVGYCPQNDYFPKELTARQVITMFALSKGMSFKGSDHEAQKLAQEFDFLKQLDTRIDVSTSENNRKLSIAVALIGNPPVLFLDEPTRGMDSASQQFCWDAIKKHIAGKTVLVATSNLEEAKALSSSPIDDGTFDRAVDHALDEGSQSSSSSSLRMDNQEWKGVLAEETLDKVGTHSDAVEEEMEDSEGYIITITSKTSDPLDVIPFMEANFPSAVLKLHSQKLYVYKVTDKWFVMSKIFAVMREAKRRNLFIKYYSIAPSSMVETPLEATKNQQK